MRLHPTSLVRHPDAEEPCAWRPRGADIAKEEAAWRQIGKALDLYIAPPKYNPLAARTSLDLT